MQNAANRLASTTIKVTSHEFKGIPFGELVLRLTDGKTVPFNKLTEIQLNYYKENVLPNSQGNPARQGTPSGRSSNQTGSGSGSQLGSPSLDDSNVSMDDFPQSEEPIWIRQPGLGCRVIIVGSKDELAQLKAVGGLTGWGVAGYYDAGVSHQGAYFVYLIPDSAAADIDTGLGHQPS